MRFLKTLLPLALAALLASPACAQTQLTGTIRGLGTRPLLYWYTQQGERHTDTVRVVNDHFTHAAKAGDDGTGALYFTGTSRIITFWVEPGKLLVQGDAAQPSHIWVTGTPENNLLDEHNRTVGWKYDLTATKTQAESEAVSRLYNQATIQFIKAHPAARTSAYLLYQQTKMQLNHPVAEYEKLLQGLKPAVRQSWYGQLAAERVAILRNQPTLGKAVVNFSIADTAGVQHSLATYRGKYVLLDFWGHWCHPCIEAMPKVNALHQQYADKLTIIGVALEGSNSAPLWKKAIRQHQVPGLQLSELQGTDSPVITGYNINAFPTYMLLDPQGKLVAKTNDVDEMTKKLAALGSL